MSCLGEPSRFRLVRRLLRGECCVSDLAMEVGLSQSCTTRHLQALERERLVEGERRGKRVLFRLRTDDPQVVALLAWALSGRTARTPAPVAHPGGAELHLDPGRPRRSSAPKRSPGLTPRRSRVRRRGPARPTLRVAPIPSPGKAPRPSRPAAAPTQVTPAPTVEAARPSPPPADPAPSQAQAQVRRTRTQELEDYLL